MSDSLWKDCPIQNLSTDWEVGHLYMITDASRRLAVDAFPRTLLASETTEIRATMYQQTVLRCRWYAEHFAQFRKRIERIR